MKFLIFFFLLLPHLSHAELQFAEESHQLPIANNQFLHLKVKRPIGVKQKTIPAILLFGGFETSDKSIQLVNPTKPILLVTFAYPFTAPKKVSVWRDYKLIPQIKTALHNTNTGIARLVEWAQLQKETDPAQIYLAGVSLGAPLAMMAAGPKIKGFVLVHGFGDIESTMAYSLGIRFQKSFGVTFQWAGTWLARGLSKLAWWYMALPAPLEKLRGLDAHQRVLVYTSRDDDLLPPQAALDIRRALEASGADWEERVLPGAHIRSGETELIQRLVDESLAWIFAGTH